MNYITKLQDTGGSLRTTIPSTIRDMLDLKKGDAVQWTVEIVDNKTTITLNSIEKE